MLVPPPTPGPAWVTLQVRVSSLPAGGAGLRCAVNAGVMSPGEECVGRPVGAWASSSVSSRVLRVSPCAVAAAAQGRDASRASRSRDCAASCEPQAKAGLTSPCRCSKRLLRGLPWPPPPGFLRVRPSPSPSTRPLGCWAGLLPLWSQRWGLRGCRGAAPADSTAGARASGAESWGGCGIGGESGTGCGGRLLGRHS